MVVPAVELIIPIMAVEVEPQTKDFLAQRVTMTKTEVAAVEVLEVVALAALQQETVALVLTHQFQAQPIH
jgi:hypothetical protein